MRGSSKQIVLIDTPGLADSKGRDSKHIGEIVDTLKFQKSINAFLIVLNGSLPRFDLNIQSMLFKFKDVFGDDFINNTAFVFTHWEQSENAKRVRDIKQVSEAKKNNAVNDELRKMGFNLKKDL